jgi:hypothetical protein
MCGKAAPKFGELREGDGEPIDLWQPSKRPWRNRCVRIPGLRSFAEYFSRRGVAQVYRLSMIFSENRYTPRIKSGAGFFGIML